MITEVESATLTLPTACRASTVFPDQAAVEQAGIDLDLETARAVASAVFRQIGRGRSKTRSTTYYMIVGLAFLARQEIERDGVVDPAPFPDMPTGRWPQGPQVLKRLAIDHRDLERYCADAARRASDACLPLEWALAFVPAQMWPVIAQVIAWGPAAVALRMEWATITMANTTTQVERRRRAAGSPLSKATIDTRINGVWQLMDVLVELRSLAVTSPTLPLPMLDAWTRLPPRLDTRALGAQPADQDNRGPSIEVCANRLRELTNEVRDAKMNVGYHQLRRRLLLALLCIYGGRADAMRVCGVQDYLPNYGYKDGSRGPALRLFPGKTWDPDDAHILPLPPGLAVLVEQWISFTGRENGQRDQFLFPNKRPKSGLASQPLSVHGFYSAIAGSKQGPTCGNLAIIPRGDDRYIGWHVHGFRHTAFQFVMAVAVELKAANPQFFAHVHPDEFAKAIVGHTLVKDVGAIYRDLDRTELVRAIVNEAWTQLTTIGRRLGPDPDNIRVSRERRETLKLTAKALREDIRQKMEESDRFAARADTATKTETRRLELRLQSSQAQITAHLLQDQLLIVDAQLLEAQAEFDAATTTLVELSDDLTDADHALLVQRALGEQLDAATVSELAARLAQEITVEDAASLWQVSPQTIRRWIRDGPPHHRHAPWQDGAWRHYSAKDQRLPVELINTNLLTEEQIRHLHYLQEQRARLAA